MVQGLPVFSPKAVLWTRIRMDPIHFVKLDPDPLHFGMLDPDPASM